MEGFFKLILAGEVLVVKKLFLNNWEKLERNQHIGIKLNSMFVTSVGNVNSLWLSTDSLLTVNCYDSQEKIVKWFPVDFEFKLLFLLHKINRFWHLIYREEIAFH